MPEAVQEEDQARDCDTCVRSASEQPANAESPDAGAAQLLDVLLNLLASTDSRSKVSSAGVRLSAGTPRPTHTGLLPNLTRVAELPLPRWPLTSGLSEG